MRKFFAGICLLGFMGLHVLLMAHEEDPREEENQRQGVEITNRSRTPQYIDGEAYYFHAVLQGQTLYSIARAYGVEQEDIIEENPDIREGLRYDQVIRIPVADDLDAIPPVDKIRLDEVAPMPDGRFVEHEVQRHETLFGLAREYGVSQETILFYNPQAREMLRVGHVLRIPLKESDPDTKDFRLYTVSSGETWYGISQDFGLGVGELQAMNPDVEDHLRAGDQIRVPLDTEVAETVEPEKPAERFIFLPAPEREVMPETDAYCLQPVHQDHYDIALILPLYLENLDLPEEQLAGIDTLTRLVDGEADPEPHDLHRVIDQLSTQDVTLNHPSFSFISFYHGVLVALDSIRHAGSDIRLHVFDGCSNVEKVKALTAADTLKHMDMIIGPFHERPLRHVADYAQKLDIPVVSPMLPDMHQLQDNAHLFKVRPSLETMLAGVGEYISQHFPRQNIILVHDNQPGAAQVINNFRDSLLTNIAMVNHVHDSLNLARVDGYYLEGTLVGNRRTRALVIPDTGAVQWLSPDLFNLEEVRRVPRPENVTEVIFRDEGMEGVLKAMRHDKKNVLITLIGGEPFVSNYLRQLHENRRNYHMSIFGIPEWEDYVSIEIDYLQDLNVHFFNDAFHDYQDPHIADFVRRYRELFLTEPDQDAFHGVQTAYFFFTALEAYGKEFARCLPRLNQMGYASPFDFVQVAGKEHGWENRHTAIYRIKNYRWVNVTRPVGIDLAAED